MQTVKSLRCCGLEQDGWKGERKKMKNVQISEDLFFLLVKYHLADNDEVLPDIKKALENKLEMLVRRELYTKYKTATTESEREEAREAYLDKIGMHRNFRW